MHIETSAGHHSPPSPVAPNVDKVLRQLELRHVYNDTTMGNLAVSLKVKRISTLETSNSTPNNFIQEK